MLLKAAGIAFVLALALPVFAQEPTPIDLAILTCVGPGFVPDGDPYEILDTLDQRSCRRVCKASVKGCKAVVKAIDKCGVSFLRASAKTGTLICRGWGYTASECRGINDEAKVDVDWWKAQGRIERDDCDREADSDCFSRCQSAEVSLYEGLVPSPSPEIRPGEPGDAGARDSVQYLDWDAALQASRSP
jgi:hypothetical protein